MLFARLIPIVVAVAGTFLLGGCVVVDSQMKEWLGRHESELLASWGAPTFTMNDGRGGTVLVYEEIQSFTTPGHATTNTYGTATGYGTSATAANQYGAQTYAHSNASAHVNASSTATTTYTPPTTYTSKTTRSFFVDSNGIIYSYRWRGL